MWKRILYHFSPSSVSSPLHVETAHQRSLMTDLIHTFKAWHGFFFAAAAKFFLILLQKCQISNWCIVSFSFSLMCFLICECQFVVIWSTVTSFVLKNLSPLINPTFSVLLEFFGFRHLGYVHSSNFISNSIHEKVSLSPLQSLLRQHEPCSFNWLNIELFSLQHLSWTTPANYCLWNW